jgi:hypothetical protein
MSLLSPSKHLSPCLPSHYILDDPMVSLALLVSSSLVPLLGLPLLYLPFFFANNPSEVQCIDFKCQFQNNTVRARFFYV